MQLSPLKESRTSTQDTPDPTKSSTEPLVVIEDVVGDDDDNEDEAPAPDRSGSSNVKGIHEFQTVRVTPHQGSGD